MRDKERRITLWNTCFGLVISVPGRGQSTLSAVTFPFSTLCSSEEMSFSVSVCLLLIFSSQKLSYWAVQHIGK